MFAKHCSDEQLLKQLDGELGWLERVRVSRHLGTCWSCRCRLGAIDRQIQTLLERIDSQPLPEPIIHQARDRFFQAVDLEVPSAAPARNRRLPYALAAGLLIAVSGYGWLSHIAPPAVQSLPPTQPLRPTRNTAPPSKTVQHPVSATPLLAPRILPVIPSPVPERIPETPIDMESLEIHLRLALHHAKTCLGEGIEVIRTGGRFAVRGVVRSEARRNEIALQIAALTPARVVELQLAVPHDRANEAGTGVEPDTVISPVLSQIPFEPLLKKQLQTTFPNLPAPVIEARVLDFSSRMLGQADLALSHAWALGSFEALYPRERVASMSPADQALAKDILRDHAASLADLAAQLTSGLEFQLGAVGREEMESVGSGMSSGALLSLVQEMHSICYDLFACGTRQIADVRGESNRLLVLARRAQAIASRLNTGLSIADSPAH